MPTRLGRLSSCEVASFAETIRFNNWRQQRSGSASYIPLIVASLRRAVQRMRVRSSLLRSGRQASAIALCICCSSLPNSATLLYNAWTSFGGMSSPPSRLTAYSRFAPRSRIFISLGRRAWRRGLSYLRQFRARQGKALPLPSGRDEQAAWLSTVELRPRPSHEARP